MASPDVRALLLAHFPNDSSSRPEQWSKLWEKGDFLPWDRGSPNPALVDMLSDKQELVGTCFKESASGQRERKKAFVPGCGRGYDVLLLASFGYDAYGLEVSDKVVELCLQEQAINGHKYPVFDESAGAGKATFIKGDFFSNDWEKHVQGGAEFDLVYDYTVSIFSDLKSSKLNRLICETCSSFVHCLHLCVHHGHCARPRY